MKRTTEVLSIGLLIIFLTALFAGPATAALISNGDFELCEDDADLRDKNSPDVWWYESKGTNPSKVMLHDGASAAVWGNDTQMAHLYGDQAGSGTGSAYLTQDLAPAQTTGTFSVSFDIAIESVYNRSYPNKDASGFIYVGDDNGATDGPNSGGSERFVYLGFYDPGGGTSGQNLQLVANNNSVEVTDENELSYDTWYTITLDINVAGGTYDVTVEGTGEDDTYIQETGITRYQDVGVESLSFYINGTGNQFGNGEYYVDNVVVPIPGTLYLLGSGIIGLVAIRRRFNG